MTSSEFEKQKRRDYQKSYRKNHPDLIKERKKKYSKTEQGKSNHKKACSKYVKNNPDKRKESSKKYKEKVRKTLNGWASNIFSAIKSRCKNNNMECSITKNDLIEFFKDRCPVLGIKLTFSEKRDTSPSVDRIDNSRGYTRDNIRIISMRANRFKSDASMEELKLLANDYLEITKF